MPNIIKSTQCYKARKIDDAIDPVPSRKQETQKQESNQTQSLQEVIEIADELIQSANKRASEIIAQAEKQGQQMISDIYEEATQQTQIKCELETKQAYEDGFTQGRQIGINQGFEEGYQDGLLQASNEQRLLTDTLSELIHQVCNQKERFLNTFEDELLDMFLHISKTVIKTEIKNDPTYLLDLVKEILGDYRKESWVRIKLAQKSYELLNKEDINKLMGRNVSLVVDHDLEETDCICETPSVVYDVGIETQFRNLETMMAKIKKQEYEQIQG